MSKSGKKKKKFQCFADKDFPLEQFPFDDCESFEFVERPEPQRKTNILQKSEEKKSIFRDEPESYDAVALATPGGGHYLARKFSLRVKVELKREELKVINRLRDQFVKFRNLENIFIEFAVRQIRIDPTLVNQFRSGTTTAYKGAFYDFFFGPSNAFGFDLKTPKSFKKWNFMERAQRCAAFYPYHAVRNWIVKNETLKTICDDLTQLLSNPTYAPATLSSFLGKGTLSKGSLNVMNSHLTRNTFGQRQFLSREYLLNHIRHLRNLLAKNRALDTALRQETHSLLANPQQINTFSNDILNSFTKARKKQIVPINPNDLAEYFIGTFVKIVKSRTTKLAKRRLRARAGKLKGKFALVKLVNSIPFRNINDFQYKRNSLYLDALQQQLLNSAHKYDAHFVLSKIKIILTDYFKELLDPKRNLTKSAFKPAFSRVYVNSLDQAGFIEYFLEKLKHKIMEHISHLFLTGNIASHAIIEIEHIKNNIYDTIPTPKMKELATPIVSFEQILEIDKTTLSYILNFLKRTQKDVLYVSNGKNKREVEKEREFKSLLQQGYELKPPTLKMEGRKVIACQPFYKIKGVEAPAQTKQSRHDIEMGVDIGLKHFADLSVWDNRIGREIARYFLDQRALFDMKFDDTTGKFEFHSVSAKKRPTNAKLKLIHLRKEIREKQSEKNDLENRYPSKRFYHTEKTLSYLWNKVNNVHSEIVHQISHKIMKIAQYHGASRIKFENLKWAKHSKRSEVGQFLAWNQVLMFFSQVQWHVSQNAARKGIETVLVDARDTSKICSKCRILRSTYKDKKNATRRGKQFICVHPSHARFQLDADLNAARNITLSPPI